MHFFVWGVLQEPPYKDSDGYRWLLSGRRVILEGCLFGSTKKAKRCNWLGPHRALQDVRKVRELADTRDHWASGTAGPLPAAPDGHSQGGQTRNHSQSSSESREHLCAALMATGPSYL